MKEKRNLWWALALMLIFGLTQFLDRPLNFSAAYALVFCCGVYLPRRLAWWLPLVTLASVDLLENWRDSTPFQGDQLGLYLAFGLVIFLGTRFRPGSKWYVLVAGGLLGAILFYLVTNTASWWLNPYGSPEYTRDLKGWVTALTKGVSGFAPTWMFFRNTLLSGGLFTGLFVAAMKFSQRVATEEEEDEKPEGKASPEEPEPESA